MTDQDPDEDEDPQFLRYRRWYIKHRTEVLVRYRAYYHANKERIKVQMRSRRHESRVVRKVADTLGITRAEARKILGLPQRRRYTLYGPKSKPKPWGAGQGDVG